jgi:transposase
MTRSPLAFTQQALEVARAALPAYSSKFSKKDFTRHQHFALLALKTFLKMGYRDVVDLLGDWSELRAALELKKVPHFTTLQKAHARFQKKNLDALLRETQTPAPPQPAPTPPVRAAVDSTGYDARPVSRYFTTVCGRPTRQKRWPKLTAVVDTRTHLFLGASVTRAPRQDAPQLLPVVRQAVKHTPIDTLLADAGYDSETNHATCREKLSVRSTVIALNWRGSRKWPRAKYRRQMVRRFRKKPRGSRSKRVYGQRAQAESVFSRNKRRWGASVAAVKWPNQKTEILLKVLAHNIMLLAPPKIST